MAHRLTLASCLVIQVWHFRDGNAISCFLLDNAGVASQGSKWHFLSLVRLQKRGSLEY
jgi:hypothetical protein